MRRFLVFVMVMGIGTVGLLAVMYFAPVPPANPTQVIPTATPTPTVVTPAWEKYKGISVSPKSFSNDDLVDFFAKASQDNQVISWVGDWQALNETSSAPVLVMQLTAQYRYQPLIILSLANPGRTDFLRPLTSEQRKQYLASLETFVEKYQPPYLGIGVEMNMLADRNPQAFAQFVDLYQEAYRRVKVRSPQTKIFTTWQYEYANGLQGGLWGKQNNSQKNQWALIKAFSPIDALGLTTYPGLIYPDPKNIPDNYYSIIKQYTAQPVLFTESGWFRDGPSSEWQSSASEQAAYIKRWVTLSNDLPIALWTWSFMYDQNTHAPFKTMGLLKTTQETSAAWQAWKEDFRLTVKPQKVIQ